MQWEARGLSPSVYPIINYSVFSLQSSLVARSATPNPAFLIPNSVLSLLRAFQFFPISLELFISTENAPMLCRNAPASGLMTPKADRAIITALTVKESAMFW